MTLRLQLQTEHLWQHSVITGFILLICCAPQHLSAQREATSSRTAATIVETWKVTPGAAVAAGGRVSLAFFMAEQVLPGNHFAQMLGNNIAVSIDGKTVTANVVLRYRAAAVGEKTRIDCIVGPSGKPMRLEAPDGVKTSDSGSLSAMYVAPDLNSTSFTIRSSSIGGWSFHSCSVSRLQ